MTAVRTTRPTPPRVVAPVSKPAAAAPALPGTRTAPASGVPDVTQELPYGLFHTGDLHTGAFRYIPNHLDRTGKMFSEILRIVVACKAKVRILTIVGDAYDRKTITEEERNLFLKFVVDLLAAGVHVILINGNHDFYKENLTLLEPLRLMSNLAANLHVHLQDPGTTVIGDIGFGCVPCTQELTTERLTAYAEMLYAQAHKPKYFYMLVHEAVYGAVNHKRTWKAASDKYLRVPDMPFVTGWMLADIHERQQIHQKAWYCGSPYQVKADESDTCGILQWAGSRVRFLPLDVPGFRYTDDVNEARALAAKGHYVRFTGTADEAVLKTLPATVLCTGDIAAIELDIDTTVAPAVVSKLGSLDLIAPLPAFLAKDGLNERQQRRGVEIITEIRGYLTDRAASAVVSSGGFDDEED